jgi:hypothetical protein
MHTESDVKSLVAQFNENNRNKTFAEFIVHMYEGKYIEIYLGDSYEDISTEQVSTSYPAVFCGRVVSAFKECLIINSVYVERTSKSKKMKLGNLVLINERAIRGLTEIDGQGIMEDMFLRSKESLTLKEEFVDKDK